MGGRQGEVRKTREGGEGRGRVGGVAPVALEAALHVGYTMTLSTVPTSTYTPGSPT